MSAVRWTGTTAAMCAVAWGLRLLGPGATEIRAGLTDAQGLVDRTGADALVLVVVTALAWLVWAWGSLGLLLTALSTVPGAAGRLAGLLLVGVLPRAARRAAAVALGVGLSTIAPVVLSPAGSPLAVAAAVDSPTTEAAPDHPAPDWPGAPPPAVPAPAPAPPAAMPAPASAAPAPDWPQIAADDHVVVRGDCLWDIAADHLHRQRPDVPAAPADIQRAVHAWWETNAAVIGPDPDLLLPGQVLRPPPG